MAPYAPTQQTLIVVGVFTIGYLAFLLHRTLRQKLDLYDLFMLSTVAVLPAVFAFFPATAGWIAELAGVAFPFVVMFGLLLAVLFMLVHRLTAEFYRLDEQNRALAQELSLLHLEVRAAARGNAHS